MLPRRLRPGRVAQKEQRLPAVPTSATALPLPGCQVHFAEEYNELHHLQIMESLGGDQLWLDRFFAQVRSPKGAPSEC